MNEENLQKYQNQLEIGNILLKNEENVTEEEIKKVNNFLEDLEKQNKDSKEYTFEEFENMLNKKFKELENAKIQARIEKRSLAFDKSAY